jgi:hypothetical protein
MKQKIKLGWTCSDDCHSFHSNKALAYLHYLFIKVKKASEK